jgi:hypothetical protein
VRYRVEQSFAQALRLLEHFRPLLGGAQPLAIYDQRNLTYESPKQVSLAAPHNRVVFGGLALAWEPSIIRRVIQFALIIFHARNPNANHGSCEFLD